MRSKHGGNIYEVAKKYGYEESEILDFSANINPLGVPNSLKNAIISNINSLVNYPDPNYRDLVKAIAEYNGINEEYILPGNGATEIIFKFIEALSPKKALILAPTFSEYERSLRRVKCTVEYFYLDEKNDFKLDKNRFMESMNNDYDLIVLCNPNNPTGQIIDRKILSSILSKARENQTNLMVDEAFIEFVDSEELATMLEYIHEYKNLYIIRAMTKFFAVPGIRLGYGITSNKEIISSILDKREPWTINTFASMAGRVLLTDKEYITQSKDFFNRERKFMYDNLKNLNFIEVYRPEANYIFLKLLKEMDSLQESLIKRKILIRSCDNYINLDSRYFRAAIKDRNSNNKFIKAMKEVLYES